MSFPRFQSSVTPLARRWTKNQKSPSMRDVRPADKTRLSRERRGWLASLVDKKFQRSLQRERQDERVIRERIEDEAVNYVKQGPLGKRKVVELPLDLGRSTCTLPRRFKSNTAEPMDIDAVTYNTVNVLTHSVTVTATEHCYNDIDMEAPECDVDTDADMPDACDVDVDMTDIDPDVDMDNVTPASTYAPRYSGFNPFARVFNPFVPPLVAPALPISVPTLANLIAVGLHISTPVLPQVPKAFVAARTAPESVAAVANVASSKGKGKTAEIAVPWSQLFRSLSVGTGGQGYTVR